MTTPLVHLSPRTMKELRDGIWVDIVTMRNGQRMVLRDDTMLTPGDAAWLLGVTPRTLRRWADAGLLASMRGPSGHHRYRYADLMATVARRGE